MRQCQPVKPSRSFLPEISDVRNSFGLCFLIVVSEEGDNLFKIQLPVVGQQMLQLAFST